jgi:ribosome maturation factor RimP
MSRHNPTIARVIRVIEPAIEAAGYELVDVRFTLEQGGWVLRVAVDLPPDPDAPFDPAVLPTDQVDIADCEHLSRELSTVLDVDDPIPQAYSLEVSSPGIDRPLRTAAHFRRFAGAEAKIQLAVPQQTPAGERRNYKGILGAVEGEGDAATFVITVDGVDHRLPLGDVDHARLVPDWDAVMKGGSGVGPKQTQSSTGKSGKPGKPGTKRSNKAARA